MFKKKQHVKWFPAIHDLRYREKHEPFKRNNIFFLFLFFFLKFLQVAVNIRAQCTVLVF